MPPDAIAVLARRGRSFRLAGRLLPRRTLADAAELYAFCRAVDDLADDAPDRLALLGLRRAVLAADPSHRLAAPFLTLHARTGVDPSAAVALIDTVLLDFGPVRMPDEAALLRYAYGVAGTVGLMMCTVLGATDPRAVPHAIDLGVAMQLTNIARDVAEDAARDRLYLPATWLPHGLTARTILGTPEPAFAAVRQLLARADRRYRSAEQGFDALPWRVRPAIRAAARLYEEIGLRVLEAGPAYLARGRCVVPLSRRLAVMAGCLVDRPRRGPHDKQLHAAFAGLPGAHA